MLFNGTVINHKYITGRICEYHFISRPVSTFMIFKDTVIMYKYISVSTFMLFNGTLIIHKCITDRNANIISLAVR